MIPHCNNTSCMMLRGCILHMVNKMGPWAVMAREFSQDTSLGPTVKSSHSQTCLTNMKPKTWWNCRKKSYSWRSVVMFSSFSLTSRRSRSLCQVRVWPCVIVLGNLVFSCLVGVLYTGGGPVKIPQDRVNDPRLWRERKPSAEKDCRLGAG